LAIRRLKKKYKNFKVKFIIKKNKKLLAIITKVLGIEKFAEFIPVQNDMTNFYNSIDFMLIPSIKEPFGLVVTEAMSFSKIPILSSVCGAVDLIHDNENGMIIDYSKNDKVKMLANKMEEAMLLSDEEYTKIAENANQSIKQLSWENFAQQYVNLAEAKIQTNDTKISKLSLMLNSPNKFLDRLNGIINRKVKQKLSEEYKMLYELDED